MVSCCCGCAITGKGQFSNPWLAVVVAVPLLGGSTLEPVVIAVVLDVLLLERVNSRTTLEPVVSCCCGCAITGKSQLSNQWLAVVVAVPLLERVNSRTNG
jgi:hypothetical protein